MRPRLCLPRPPAAPSDGVGDGVEERPGDGRRPAVVRARNEGRPRRVQALDHVRPREPARSGRRARERAVRRALALCLTSLTLGGCGGNDEGSGFLVGAVDDAVRNEGPTLDQLQEAGFRAVGITSSWQPGIQAPSESEIAVLRGVVERAEDTRIFLAVYQPGSATRPLTPAWRGELAGYVTAIMRDVPEIRDVIVGNEPNLNRFWMPQFDAAGGDVAAPAYLALLSEVYDAVKQADPKMTVWGGALAPRGIDRPGTGRDTHSPTTFIRDLGEAYLESGRDELPMDGFAFHPYPASSSVPPDRPTDPKSSWILMADYEEKLVPALRAAFGRELPVLYSELGVETVAPPAKASVYDGEEP